MHPWQAAKQARLAARRADGGSPTGPRYRVTGHRRVPDDDVRAMRYWAASEAAAGLSEEAQARALAATYGVGVWTVRDILKRHAYVGIEGPPMAARYWVGREDEHWWSCLIWLLLCLKLGLTLPQSWAVATDRGTVTA